MSTTINAIKQGKHPTLAFVMAIEGYPYLITSWEDASAVVTAWAGKDWSAARVGLEPIGEITQEIVPFETKFDDQALSVIVTDENVGKDLFNTRSTAAKSRLQREVTPLTESIRVESNTDFADSGTIYIGNENITYTSKSFGFRFEGVTRGKYAPFSTHNDDGRWARHHTSSSYGQGGQIYPYVSAERRNFHGAWVGIWVHQVTGGVLDVLAEAELLFAGKIDNVGDSSNTGSTIITIQSLLGTLTKKMLFKEQYIGQISEEIYLSASGFAAGSGWPPSNKAPQQIRLKESTITSAAGTTYYTATPWRVVDSGASDTWEINEGWYTRLELFDSLNAWLTAEKTAGRLGGNWLVPSHNTGNFTRFEASYHDSLAAGFTLRIDRDIARFLGWPAKDSEEYELVPIKESDISTSVTSIYLKVISPEDQKIGSPGRGGKFKFDSFNGSYYETPTEWQEPYVAYEGDGWCHLLADTDKVFAAKHSTDLLFNDARPAWGLVYAGIDKVADYPGEEEAKTPEMKQLLVICGTPFKVIAGIFCSTASVGYNHPEYDSLGWQMGAEIPWTLLNSTFVNSVTRLGRSSDQDSMYVVLDRPTPLKDVVVGELGIRDAHLVFKYGTLRLVVPAIPTQIVSRAGRGVYTSPVYTLNTSNKAAAVDSKDKNWSAGRQTKEYLKNQIKLKFGMDITDKYHHTIELVNQASISDLGEESSIEIAARNMPAGGFYSGQQEHAEALISDLGARVLSQYAWPMTVVTRTIDYTQASLAPGDLIKLTDDHIRNPNTGERGLTDHMGWVRSVSFDWSTILGSVELVMNNKDDLHSIYNPAGETDLGFGEAGYDLLTQELKIKDSPFSPPRNLPPVYDWGIGDKVKLLITYPDNPFSPTTFTDTITAVDAANDKITLQNDWSSTFTGISPSSVLVTGADYKDTTTAQKEEYTYVCASGTNYLEGDSHQLYTVTPVTASGISTVSGTELMEYIPAELTTSGVAFSPALNQKAAKITNNLVNYKSSCNQGYLLPVIEFSTTNNVTSEQDWRTLQVYHVYVGDTAPLPGQFRLLNVAPFLGTTDAGAVAACRATVSTSPPQIDPTVSGAAQYASTYYTPYKQATWETSSTSMVVPVASGIPFPGGTPTLFMTVEVLSDTNGESVKFGGIPTCWVGPIQDNS